MNWKNTSSSPNYFSKDCNNSATNGFEEMFRRMILREDYVAQQKIAIEELKSGSSCHDRLRTAKKVMITSRSLITHYDCQKCWLGKSPARWAAHQNQTEHRCGLYRTYNIGYTFFKNRIFRQENVKGLTNRNTFRYWTFELNYCQNVLPEFLVTERAPWGNRLTEFQLADGLTCACHLDCSNADQYRYGVA